MKKKLYIDGRSGTTGLLIEYLLEDRSDLELLRLPLDQQKNLEAKKAVYQAADLIVLCLPNAAAKEAVRLFDQIRQADQGYDGKILDASSEHRCHPDWVFGLPELRPSQPEAIRHALKVTNPGCYATGFLLAVAPLVENAWLDLDAQITVQAVSGFSGGGKELIQQYARANPPIIKPYGLKQDHKHLPEMQRYSKLTHPPHFLPIVGDYFSGISLHVPLFFDQLNAVHRPKIKHQTLVELYRSFYKTSAIEVLGGAPPLEQPNDLVGDRPLARWFAEHHQQQQFQSADFLQQTQFKPALTSEEKKAWVGKFRQCTLGIEEQPTSCSLFAVYNNLGKGAATQALQNIDLMLGCGV